MAVPYRLASREHRREDTVIDVCGTTIGGAAISVVAGPCAVESDESAMASASTICQLGIGLFRAGAYKPRTSPYSFRGRGADGLAVLEQIRASLGMGVVTEVLDPRDVQLVAEHADVLQVGTRNMQNYTLLEELGRCGRPVLLKRGMAATIEELLCAAEYVLAAGNRDVILCERGIRSFEPSTRATLDLNAVAVLREMTHLPVLVDPSHATGRAELVGPVALGAVAAGAHGLLVEAHHDPANSLVDARQTIGIDALAALLDDLERLGEAFGRPLQLEPVRHVTTTPAA